MGADGWGGDDGTPNIGPDDDSGGDDDTPNIGPDDDSGGVDGAPNAGPDGWGCEGDGSVAGVGVWSGEVLPVGVNGGWGAVMAGLPSEHDQTMYRK